MATITYNSGASGVGTEALSIDWGPNPERTQRTRTYTIDGGKNSLVVTQVAASELFITGGGAKSAILSSEAQTIEFTGTTNAKVLKYSSSNDNVSVSVVELSDAFTPNSVGTTWTSVSNPAKGTSYFRYTVNITIPANFSGTCSVTVFANDVSSDSGQLSGESSVSVSQSGVSINSVTIVDVNGNQIDSLVIGVGNSYNYNNNTITVNNSSRNKLNYSANPSNFTPATTGAVTWSSTNTEVVTVNNEGLITGVSDGTAEIECVVKDYNGTIKRDTCSIVVYGTGTISAENETVISRVRSGAIAVEWTNIDASTISISEIRYDSGSGWVTDYTLDKSGIPYYIRLELQSNAQGSTSRSVNIDVLGTDMLGNTITKTVILTQNAPSSSDIPCTSMIIEPSGSVVINNSGGKQEFDLTYYPNNPLTTQNDCTWSFTMGDGTAVDSNIATLEEDEDVTKPNVRYVIVHSGANNSTLKLSATNRYNPSIVSNTVTITATYVAPGNIVASPSSVIVDYADDRSDTTNGAPSLTGTNLVGSLEVGSFDGFIQRAYISNNVLYTEFSYNSGAQRTGTVVVRDSGDYNTTCTVLYTQRAYSEPETNKLRISAIEGIPDPLAPDTVKFAINYDNYQITSQSFTNQNYTLRGYNSSNDETSFSVYGSLSDIVVAPRKFSGSAERRIYTVSVDPQYRMDKYSLSVSATSNNQNISDSVTGWDGDDVIDVTSEDDTH